MITNPFHKKIVFFIVMLFVCHSVFSQSPVPGLLEAFSKTNSSKEKADICFNISSWYSDRLKIDSGFFYANKIKEFSQPAGYETGVGKYYLALSFALRYRSRYAEAEENVLKAIEIFSSQKEILFLGRSYWQLATIQYIANNIIQSRKDRKSVV